MGEEFEVDKPPTLRVKLARTAPFERVYVIKDNEYVYSISPRQRVVEFEWTDRDVKSGKTSYYYVRGEQVGQTEKRTVKSTSGEKIEREFSNGEVVWASPMWITYRPWPPACRAQDAAARRERPADATDGKACARGRRRPEQDITG